MTGRFCAGKLYRLSVAVREQLLLKIPRDVAAILRNQPRGGSTGDSSDEDDQETGEKNDAPMHEADGDSDGEIEVGLAIAPAGFGIVRPAHVGRFGAELHGSSVLFKWNMRIATEYDICRHRRRTLHPCGEAQRSQPTGTLASERNTLRICFIWRAPCEPTTPLE